MSPYCHVDVKKQINRTRKLSASFFVKLARHGLNGLAICPLIGFFSLYRLSCQWGIL